MPEENALDPSDALMARLASGDDDALGQLIEMHIGGAFDLARRITRSRQDAEDVVQDAFIRLIRTSKRYTPQGRFRSYLCTIVANLSRDLLRRRRTTSLPEFDLPAETAPDPVDEAQASETAEILEHAVADLPERQKLAFELVIGRSLSYDDAAEVMGTTPGAVRVSMVRARKKIAAHPRLAPLLKGREDEGRNRGT